MILVYLFSRVNYFFRFSIIANLVVCSSMLVFLGNRTTKTITSFILLACWIMCVCVISRHGHRGQEVSEQKIPKQQNLVSSHVSTIQSHLGFFAHVIILSITRFEVRKRFNISHYLTLLRICRCRRLLCSTRVVVVFQSTWRNMTVVPKLLVVLCVVLSADALVPFIDGGKSMPKLVSKC